MTFECIALDMEFFQAEIEFECLTEDEAIRRTSRLNELCEKEGDITIWFYRNTDDPATFLIAEDTVGIR